VNIWEYLLRMIPEVRIDHFHSIILHGAWWYT
jgi:hypothetical protein